MAISHFSIRIACRKKGHNAVKNSAYRRGESYVCERSGETFSFKKKKDVIHSELAVPENAPKWAHELSKNYGSSDAAKVWNAVEFGEKRKDAQLCRDFEFALPRELGYEQHLDVIRDYV